MGLRFTLVAYSVVTFGLLAVVCNGANFRILLKKAGFCPGPRYAGLPVVFQKPVYTMTAETESLTMSATIIFKKEVKKVTAEVEVSRCLSEEAQTCTKIFAVNCSHSCDIMHQKNQIWSTIFSNIKDFPEKCPIPKGRYVMSNAYFDYDKGIASRMGRPGFWMAKLTFFDKDGLLQCLWGSGTIKRNRIKKP